MNEPGNLLGPMRLPFLVLTPACVLLGTGTAVWTHGSMNILHFVLAFVGATAAHISVNALNEYFDFRSGLDFKTLPTPFSGGSRTLPSRPELARSALGIGLAGLGVAALIGVYFLAVRGFSLLPLGILGLVLIFVYTNWITRYPFLCLVAPGLGFGTLMVMGTDFALTGSYSWTSFVASLVPFFLVSDLLLLNQFPDVEADQSVGRRHYPIVVGRKKSSIIYGAFLLFTYLSLPIGILLGYLPLGSLLGLVTLVIAVPTAIGAFRNAEHPEKLGPYMALNVLLNVTTPILVAVGLFISS